jgi:hypothetical protein
MLFPHSFRSRALAAAFALAALPALAAAGAPVPPAVPPAALLDRPFGAADVADFKTPPRVFLPETWFHYLGGNVAKNGITADLEAIAAAGLSGVQLFHGNQGGGQWPGEQESIACLSPRWDDHVRHTAQESQRLGLRFTMQNCPGWSMAGGPWIKPENAMRHLVWARAAAQSGKPVATVPSPRGSDYRDIAIIAFPTPIGDFDTPPAPKEVRVIGESGANFPWANLIAGKGGAGLAPVAAEKPYRVEFTYAAPVTLRTLEIAGPNQMNHAFSYQPDMDVVLEAVLPGGTVRELLRSPMPQGSWQDDRPVSFALPDTPAATYRLTIATKHNMNLRSLRLLTAARKHNWEMEAGWVLHGLVRANDGNIKQDAAAWIDPANIHDVSKHFDRATGKLDWTPPAAGNATGAWTLLRIGHVNTGHRNAPAPREATGWESDKLSDTGPAVHYAGYIGRLAKGPLNGGLLQGVLLDSWECKTQTWTATMEADFRAYAGYDLRRWFPAVLGYVVGTPETTTRFLRDWRGNIGDLFANKFYAGIARRARADGVAVQYETAAGDIFPADILEYYKHADIPMTEFWQPISEGFVGDINFKPIKPTASAARLYGKPRVAAEAFTSFSLTWNEHFDMLKEVANVKSVEGVTHMVFHNYTHNPRVEGFLPPGSAFGTNIGTPFLRGQTWWRHMPEFTAYLARLSFLLERGKPVSDVLWYLGDEIPHKPDQKAAFPDGYKYDYCNPDVLLNRLGVDAGGNLATPEGIAYRVLWIPDARRMLPQTLEKLRDLVRAGATIIGGAPQGLATLSGGAQAQARFDATVKEIWGDDALNKGSQTRHLIRRLGKGRVFSGIPLETALGTCGLLPDVRGARSTPAAPLDDTALWTHRRAAGADWYFVSTPQGRAFDGELTFRARGRVEIWDPVTGTRRAASARRANDAQTTVSLSLPKAGAAFVVFRHGRGAPAAAAQTGAQPRARNSARARNIPLDGGWTLAFPAGWGAPAEPLTLAALVPWKDLPGLSDEARAFSGTATYTKTFDIPAAALSAPLVLDLGNVEFIAAVKLNGKPVRTLWAPPYRLDLSGLAQSGKNTLEIDVTSTWYNRLAYDNARPAAQRKTWTLGGPRGAKRFPYGLLGPVVLRLGEELRVK